MEELVATHRMAINYSFESAESLLEIRPALCSGIGWCYRENGGDGRECSTCYSSSGLQDLFRQDVTSGKSFTNLVLRRLSTVSTGHVQTSTQEETRYEAIHTFQFVKSLR